MISRFIHWLQTRREQRHALSIKPAPGQKWVNDVMSVRVLEVDGLGMVKVEQDCSSLAGFYSSGVTQASAQLISTTYISDWPAYVLQLRLKLYRPKFEGYQ